MYIGGGKFETMAHSLLVVYAIVCWKITVICLRLFN